VLLSNRQSSEPFSAKGTLGVGLALVVFQIFETVMLRIAHFTSVQGVELVGDGDEGQIRHVAGF
jgi:hypothetical protein